MAKTLAKQGRSPIDNYIGTEFQCRAKSHMSGERCRKAAVKDGTVCRTHGGALQKRALDRKRAEASARSLIGIPREVDPSTAILEAVYEAAGNVAFYRHILHEIQVEGENELPDDDRLRARERYRKLYKLRTTDLEQVPHIFLKLYNEALDASVRFSKVAIDAGLAERTVRVAEIRAAALMAVIVRVLASEEAGLNPARQERVRKLLADGIRETVQGVIE